MTKIQDNARLCGTPTHNKFLFKTPDNPPPPHRCSPASAFEGAQRTHRQALCRFSPGF